MQPRRVVCHHAEDVDEAIALKRVHRLAQSDRLRLLREGSGLSQSDVARFIGVDPSQVSRWERCAARPRGHHAVTLLRLLDGDDA